MSQRQRRRNEAPSSQESDAMDLDEHSPSQPSTSSQRQSLTAAEEAEVVSRVMRYLLVMDRSKRVIQRSQIIKCAFGTHGRHYHRVMDKVKKDLLRVFGYKLEEFETNKYIITNAIENDELHLSFTPLEKSNLTLLFLVLAHIFMSEKNCSEEELWSFLRDLGIVAEDDYYHDHFGNVEYLVTHEFVKQQYLDKLRIGIAEPPKFEYKWGIRADKELSKRHVLEFISKVYGNRSIKTWPAQYQAMLKSEQTAERREESP